MHNRFPFPLKNVCVHACRGIKYFKDTKETRWLPVGRGTEGLVGIWMEWRLTHYSSLFIHKLFPSGTYSLSASWRPQVNTAFTHSYLHFNNNDTCKTCLWGFATAYFCIYSSTVCMSVWGFGCSWVHLHKIWSVSNEIPTYVSESLCIIMNTYHQKTVDVWGNLKLCTLS